ncbi:hypothetical protein D3C76_1396860 [compost metagenome]
MSKFKTGDLALVIGPSVNTGRCVELVRCVVGPAKVDLNEGRNWVDVPDGIHAWVVAADRLEGVLTRSGKTICVSEVMYHENRLMPLRGDFQPEQQKAKEVEA